MNFAHPLLFSGSILLLIGVPILIHLINMIRHRRVQWAAMEFLLASQKKNRRWVWLRQILLLLARIAAVALLLLMLAGWTLTGDWTKVLGDSRTHHYILLDDSYSMSATNAGTSEFDRAKKSVENLVEKIAQQSEQSVTLIRFSQAAKLSLGGQSDISGRVVGKKFRPELEKLLTTFQPSQLSVSAKAALTGLETLISDRPQEKRVLHLISDFRQKDWQATKSMKEQLAKLSDANIQIHLVNSSLSSQPNLAVTGLQTRASTHAAGVPLQLKVTVKNFGSATVEDVLVSIRYAENSNSTSRSSDASNSADRWQRLPALNFDEIGPGKSVTQKIQLRFESAGQHEVQAKLEGDYLNAVDSLVVDNLRTAVVNIVSEVPVLVIDGDPRSGDSDLLVRSLNPALFRPNSKLRTGLKPIVRTTSFLRQSPQLDQYHSIYLINTGRLEESAIAQLESYVAAGGGLAFFTGPQTSRSFVNESLYKDAQGLFPAEILGQAELFVDEDIANPQASIIIEKSSLLGVLADPKFGVRDFRTSRYQTLPKGWQPPKDSAIQVIARLRNNAPLILGKTFGDGQVVAVLTTAGRTWNDWAGQLHYPLFVQVLQGRLAVARHKVPEYQVGSPYQYSASAEQFQQNGTFITPHPADSPLSVIKSEAKRAENDQLVFKVGENEKGETDVSGTYQLELLSKPSGMSVKRFAVNVDSAEGDLKTVSVERLATELKGVPYVYHGFSELQQRQKHLAGVDTSIYLFYLLIALLLGEMVLSFAASYHPKPLAKGASR